MSNTHVTLPIPINSVIEWSWVHSINIGNRFFYKLEDRFVVKYVQMWEPRERNWRGHDSDLLPYCARRVWVFPNQSSLKIMDCQHVAYIYPSKFIHKCSYSCRKYQCCSSYKISNYSLHLQFQSNKQ